ncbi:MAG: hypothetical protein JW881_01255 [Spirochaetales bacterium]|nr:hypothetical protein [Spirochaetales bacterium]
MYTSLKELSNYRILTHEGEIGKVSDFYFDEHIWTVRYIVVNTGGLILKNLVLLSPIFVDGIDNDKKDIKVDLTKDQVENSPDIDTAKPLSRLKEIEISRYYQTGFYWTGYSTWGMGGLPAGLRNISKSQPAENITDEETYLRSMDEVCGYHVETKTGGLGHISDIIINRNNWEIDFFVLNTGNIFPGEDIEVSIRWIDSIRWETRKVYIKLPKELVKSAGK